MSHDDFVHTLEGIAVDRSLTERQRHLRLVAELAPLGPAAAQEAAALEAHGWRVRAAGHHPVADVLLHAEADVAAHRCEVAA